VDGRHLRVHRQQEVQAKATKTWEAEDLGTATENGEIGRPARLGEVTGLTTRPRESGEHVDLASSPHYPNAEEDEVEAEESRSKVPSSVRARSRQTKTRRKIKTSATWSRRAHNCMEGLTAF
jgi:hypothetical protein